MGLSAGGLIRGGRTAINFKILTNSSFGTPSRLLVDMLGFKTIEQLIADESKILVFKSLHDLAPPYL